ncbi:MAG: NnrS family protein, partial [Thiovulaceae bacterium]|nr:NnrS family protein [Sulfurimonadaceae bacterium]
MQNFTDPNQKENYFLSQPHQPFFLAGIFWAIISMLIFTIAYKLQLKGTLLLSLDTSSFHAYSLIYIVITQFFIGFLYTTFPKFCQAQAITKNYYLLTFILFQTGALLFTLGVFFSIALFQLGMAVLFIGMFSFVLKLFTIYRSSKAAAKKDQFWILVALSIGFLTHGLAITENIFAFSNDAYTIAFVLYLTFLTFSVAQRMVPFFSHSTVEKKPYFLAIVFLLLIFKVATILTDRFITQNYVDILLAIFLLKEFWRWKLNTTQAPAILKILHVALFWLPLGLLLGAVTSILSLFTQQSFLFSQTHLIALGFIVTMLIGFGTRVTLGHSGQPPHADQTTLKIFYLTQLLVFVRFALSLSFGFDSVLL